MKEDQPVCSGGNRNNDLRTNACMHAYVYVRKPKGLFICPHSFFLFHEQFGSRTTKQPYSKLEIVALAEFNIGYGIMTPMHSYSHKHATPTGKHITWNGT